MWIKDGILRGPRIIFFNLAVWIMGGLGITIAFNSSSCKSKRIDYGNCNKEENDNGIDGLPGEILCNIVSRLENIEAARTSILSKRWRNIWTMNDTLRFECVKTFGVSDHVDYGIRKSLFKAVDQCLRLYSGCNLKIKKFSIDCCFLDGYYSCHLVHWMQILSRLDIEELYLCHYCESREGMEYCDRAANFSFKLIDGFSRLNSLALFYCNVETSFVSQCNSLGRLSLWYIELDGDKLSDIFRNCPNLFDIIMEFCDLPLNLRISGPDLKLKSLIFIDCYNVYTLEISDLNSLTSIQIDTENEVEILLSYLPKLDCMHFRTPRINYDVTKDLPQLEWLLLQTSFQMLRLPPKFNAFGKVKTLFIMTRYYPYTETTEEVDLWNFAQVLVTCPFLEEFYLTVNCSRKGKENGRKWCVIQHEHLKTMELSGFSNTQNELEFCKFILTSAKVLQVLSLPLSPRTCEERCACNEEEDLKKLDKNAQFLVGDDLKRYAVSMDVFITLAPIVILEVD